MARGSDPDSRPISVAELLARAKEAGATDVAEAAANSPAATGRRHRGGKDGISVAELTGEIPRIAEPTTPPPTRDFNSADVSERAGSSAPEADVAETKPAPAVSADSAEQEEAPSDPEPEKAEPQATGPSVADTSDQHSDSETTGVISSVQAYSQVDDEDPNRDRQDDHRVLSAAERDREFEAYRNFEDVDATPSPTGEPKKKRGILGFGRKKAAAATPSAPASPRTSRDQADDTDHEVTQLIPTVTATPPPYPPAFATDGPPPPVPAESATPAQSPAPGAAPADTGRYLRFDVDDDASSRVDTTKRASSDESNAAPAQADTRGFGAFASATPAVETPAGEPSSVETPGDDANSGADAVRTRLTGSAAAQEHPPAGDRAHDEAAPAESTDKSPSVQWLLLIGQVLAGLAVGVALFWGFTELWRWNVYFALILAVAVIFGLVTLVHVVRRSQDLISTLLALGVGLLVTIGPLVLLLVAGD
ncbi:hypothetical protein [Williamsia sp. 1135]|uniref:hypothetical protein n=1 Tax=Williamsia sp. 1135 TaxID=1889262 RepID=UPI000A100B4C|nr:hypothetical protein [Williamsia sp. 1135]ORM32865.1 hypothetical protein BFL43_15310 [Williamsia sp. 1135]